MESHSGCFLRCGEICSSWAEEDRQKSRGRERGEEGERGKGKKNTVVHFVSAENPRKEGERTGSAEGDGNERGVSKEETLSL